MDKTHLKAGSELIWLWVAINSKNKQFLALSISKERNTFVAECFLSSIVKEFGKHPTTESTDSTYLVSIAGMQVYETKDSLHSSYEKSLIERTMQYIKDRTESFDDYFPCSSRKEKCNLFHVKNWLNLFVNMHNKEVLKAQVNRSK